MAVLSDYTSGMISLANGSATVTGTGTLFEVTRFREGDTLQIQNLTAIIASVDSDTQLTLTEPWTGTNIVDGPYRARQLADGTRVGTQAAMLIELLGDGTLAGIAALGVEEGKAPVGGPAGQYVLQPIAVDDNGTLAGLAELVLAANKVITTDGSGNAQQIDLGTLGRALLALATGTSAQYVQGDGTLQAKAGLPVSTATQTALDGKQNNLGFTPINKGGDTNVGAITMGASSSLTWPLNNGSNNAIFLGPTSNDAGPTGATYTRGIVYGNPSGFRGRTFFEIQHGNYHGIVVAVENSVGSPNRYFSLRSDGGFYAPGSINGTAKNFEIDHPLDPNNLDLRHCATEAPEMLVEYRGTAQLVNGRVTVDVEEHYGVRPGTFGALWDDAWVTALQNQDGFDRLRPSRLSGSVFEIFCENESSNDLVTWVVMARRNDPYVRWKGCTFTDDEGRLIVEFEKPE
ncbi:hypothetical protein [Brucella tritici]|uniref:hypothetical protein n=1 Tax=Brucella tritici TaxID=94626 RepID=UPI003D6CB3A9